MHVLIAGAGDLGLRTAVLLKARGHRVSAIRRSAHPDCAIADLHNPSSVAPFVATADAVIFCATPDQRTPAAYQAIYLDALGHILNARNNAQRVLFCSSTAVYSENSGAWVDESSPCLPPEFNGQTLLAAEQLLRKGDVALRFSGICGPGRDFARKKALCANAQPGLANHWSNRIHVDDAAAAMAFVLALPDAPSVLNVSDFFPCTQHQHYTALRIAEAAPPLPATACDATATGKRVSNARLAALGFRWAHPAACLPDQSFSQP